jgi:hypothetical protein
MLRQEEIPRRRQQVRSFVTGVPIGANWIFDSKNNMETGIAVLLYDISTHIAIPEIEQRSVGYRWLWTSVDTGGPMFGNFASLSVMVTMYVLLWALRW